MEEQELAEAVEFSPSKLITEQQEITNKKTEI